jgi:cytochrome b561
MLAVTYELIWGIRDVSGIAFSNGQEALDRYIRLFGGGVFVVLIVAYATGEEFVHTHKMIGYGIAALLVSALIWEIIKRRSVSLSRAQAGEARPREGLQSAGVALLIILPILALLAAAALLLMIVTHNYWGMTVVDEMHEVVAYFGIGLLVFYVASVLVTSIASMRS